MSQIHITYCFKHAYLSNVLFPFPIPLPCLKKFLERRQIVGNSALTDRLCPNRELFTRCFIRQELIVIHLFQFGKVVRTEKCPLIAVSLQHLWPLPPPLANVEAGHWVGPYLLTEIARCLKFQDQIIRHDIRNTWPIRSDVQKDCSSVKNVLIDRISSNIERYFRHMQNKRVRR